MTKMLSISGVSKLKSQLRKIASRTDNLEDVIVGYSAHYALWVHEMPMVNSGKPRTGKRADGSKRSGNWWDPSGKGQNKYLESVVKDKKSEIAAIVRKHYQTTGDLTNALLIAALFIQRESQQRVPVDTANLKQSAFTEKVSK